MSELSTFASRYRLGASPDWQALLTLLDLNEGFAFIVLLVPNEEGAAVCQDALMKRFAASGQKLLEMETAPPERLGSIAEALLFADAPPETGAVWVSRVVSEGAPDYVEWREAWRYGVASLNQHRNPFRRKWNVPVIFAGAPWLQELLRENAPDLWSVRTQVAWVEPEAPEIAARALQPGLVASRRGPDPEMALAEAKKLRGKPGAEAAIARLVYRAGKGFAAQYRWREAVEAFRESLAIRGKSPTDIAGFADTNYELGKVLTWTADYAGANAHLMEALPTYHQLGDTTAEASCIEQLGDIALARSDHAEARRRYEEALSLFRKVGDVLGETNCIMSLGDIALRRSDHAEARRRYEEALPLYQQAGDVLGEANCILRMGDIALERPDYAEARRRYEEALPLYRQVGHVLGEANCIWSLGNIALDRSEHSETRRRYEQALPLYRQVGDVLGEANCIQRLGDSERILGQADEAQRLYREALRLYSRIPEPSSIGDTHGRLARLTSGKEREQHVRAARAAWLSIDRPDLVQQLDSEFGASE